MVMNAVLSALAVVAGVDEAAISSRVVGLVSFPPISPAILPSSSCTRAVGYYGRRN